MEISGIIQSGAGKGAYFTQVDWVVRQCEQYLGYRPFPGTLNVKVLESDSGPLDHLAGGTDFELLPDDPAFCTARVRKVTVNGIPAAVVIPAEDVRIHADGIIEIISACSLKQTLGLKDGDPVRLAWVAPAADPRRQGATSGNNHHATYREIYEFAASAGALEGYVYPERKLTAAGLENWVRNLVQQYHDLPPALRDAIQASLDRTLGRAVQALTPVLGRDHAHIRSLTALIVGRMPRSPHDFETEKAEKAARYGA